MPIARDRASLLPAVITGSGQYCRSGNGSSSGDGTGGVGLNAIRAGSFGAAKIIASIRCCKPSQGWGNPLSTAQRRCGYHRAFADENRGVDYACAQASCHCQASNLVRKGAYRHRRYAQQCRCWFINSRYRAHIIDVTWAPRPRLTFPGRIVPAGRLKLDELITNAIHSTRLMRRLSQ